MTTQNLSFADMASIAARHGFQYDDALARITARPSAWIGEVCRWMDIEAAEKKAAAKQVRDAQWKPNSTQQRVIDLITEQSSFCPDNDMPMYSFLRASTRALIKRGIVSRTELSDTIAYSLNKRCCT